MDALSGDRGQALVVAVLALAAAAAVAIGLGSAQERLVGAARAARDAEGVAAAAGAAVADLHLAFVRGLRDERGGPRDPDVSEDAAFLSRADVRERAVTAAQELARALGRDAPAEVDLRDAGRTIEVTLHVAGARGRVTFEKARCCPR